MKKLFLLLMLMLGITIDINAQTAPNLASAKTFGLLSGSTISATDTIVVRGNAGATTSVGSRIKATTIYTGGGTVSTAITDLGTAKSFCSGQSGTTISGTLNGQILAAGVYTITGNASLTDSLTLTGDTNSIFIFNISGNISFDTLAKIKMLPIMASKVYWNIGGTVTLKKYACLSGVFLASNNISVNQLVKGNLCLLSQQAVSFNGVQSIPLPGAFFGYFINSLQNMKLLDYSVPCGLPVDACNLITNPSFEIVDNCPDNGYLWHACEWGTAFEWTHNVEWGNTNEIFALCNDLIGVPQWGVANNYFGSQTARTGENYAGFIGYIEYPAVCVPGSGTVSSNFWNWFAKDLSTPLTIGEPYYLEFYVSLSSYSNLSGTINVLAPQDVMEVVYDTAQVITTVAATSTAWTKVAACFTPRTSTQSSIVLKLTVEDPATYTAAGGNPSLSALGCTPVHLMYYYLDDFMLRSLKANAGPDIMYDCSALNFIGVPDTCSPIAGLTYTWVGADPFTIANSVILDPTNPYTEVSCVAGGTYTYQLTVTYGGCSTTDIVVVTVPGAVCSGTTIIGATTYPTGTTIIGGLVPVIVAGNLTIPSGATLKIQNDNVSFFLNKTITVLPGGTLVVDTAWLHGCKPCGNMWGGIRVWKGGFLIIKGSVIEDAIAAVMTMTLGASAIPDYQISQTIFNKNTDNIVVQANTLNMSTNTIKNSIFTCRTLPSPTAGAFITNFNTIKAALNTNTVASLTPYPTTVTKAGVRSNIGVQVTDLTNLTATVKVGSGAGGTGDMNFFDNLNYGIHITGTYIEIKNNRFQNMAGAQTVAIPVSPPPTGVGIYGPVQTTLACDLVYIGSAGADQNYFYDCFRAIEINNYYWTIINNNTFSCSSTPTVISGNTIANAAVYLKNIKEKIEVKTNTMTDWITAVFFSRNTVAGGILNPIVDINGNTINANGSGYCTQAVLYNDLLANTITTVYPFYIRNNTINDVKNGIKASYIKNNLVIYNNPAITLRYTSSGTCTGIMLEGCDKTEVKNNTINSLRIPYGSADNWDLRGIYVKGSTNNKVFCNVLTYLGQCMVFEGNCLSTTNSSYGSTTNGILGNSMDKARTGLMLRTSGVIGQQGAATFPNSNIWNNAYTFTNGRTNTYSSATANTASKLYCLNNTTHLPPAATNMYGGTSVPLDIYSIGSGGLNIATGSAITCPTTYVPAGLIVNASGLKSMDAGEVDYAEELKQLLTTALEDSTFSAANWTLQQFIYNELKEHSGLQEDSLLNAFYTANQTSSIGLLKAVNDSIESGNVAAAVSINNSVTAANNIEENQKAFNAIYLSQQDSTVIYTEADSSNLYSIASQCAVEGGDAVYQSRNFLMFFANQVIDFIDNCDANADSESEEDRSLILADATHAIKLYPNPNKGNMTLECNLTESETGTLFIYDLTGKLMSKYLLANGTKSLAIDAKALKPATYVYEIVVNGKPIKKEKLTIIK